ncbi:hypothetical protein Tco_0359442 [Tanacetum coccineum]
MSQAQSSSQLITANSCEIIGEILKCHNLKDALTLFAPSPTIYLQQFWYTVYKVQDEKEAIRFKTDHQEVDFTLDTFCTVLLLPNQTSKKPFDQSPYFLAIAQFLKSIGYVGELEFVTQFLVKNLPQPWQTLFKVLNRCTTLKKMGFDQFKINTLWIFYVIINQHNVDFAQLIWTDFLDQVEKKPHKLVQYPRYTKLIINHVYATYPDVQK